MANLDVPNGLPFTVSSKVSAPNASGAPGVYLWFLTIQFPDGVRSAVCLGRTTMPTKADAPTWHAILTVADKLGGAVSGTPTAAHFDQRMAAGDVLYWFMHSSDANYARGLWSQNASSVAARDLAAFTWGMNQLATNVANALGATPPPPMPLPPPSSPSMGPASSPPPPMQQGGGGVPMQPAPIIPPPPPRRRWPVYVGTLLVVGGLTWLVLGD
jgi:hypothetical protein